MVNIPGASNFDRIFDGAKTLAPPCSSCPRAVYQVARCAVVILLFCYKVALVIVVVVVFVCVVDKIIVLLVLFCEGKGLLFCVKIACFLTHNCLFFNAQMFAFPMFFFRVVHLFLYTSLTYKRLFFNFGSEGNACCFTSSCCRIFLPRVIGASCVTALDDDVLTR